MGLKKTDDDGDNDDTTPDDKKGGFDAEAFLSSDAFRKAINNAMTARERRLTDSLKASMQEVVTAALATTTKQKDGEGDTGDDDGGDPPEGGQQRKNGRFAKGMDPEVKRALDAAHRAADAAKKLAEDEKKKREESEGKAAANEERAILTEQLSAAGVQKDMLDVALAYLKDKQRIGRAQDGRVVWREGDDEVDVAEGVGSWAKSPLGQRFLPPRDASGSGSTPPMSGKRSAGGKPEYTDADLGNMLKSL